MTALDLTADWPVPHVGAAVLRGGRVVDTAGETGREFRLASLSKPIAAWAVLVAVDEGLLSLDTPIGQPGCTLRHLLSHAGGYPFDGPDPITKPERTRIYSNTGIEMAAAAVATAADMTFDEYLHLGVLEPLGMDATALRGSPAHALWSTVDDVCRFLAEVARPQVLSPATADQVGRTQYPDLGGIVPGVGRFEKSPWGLGFEIRGDKSPHWTGHRNTPATFGHFGGAGTMMWVDPDIDTAPDTGADTAANTGQLAVVALTDRMFDEWADTALRVWPELSDAVIAEHAGVVA